MGRPDGPTSLNLPGVLVGLRVGFERRVYPYLISHAEPSQRTSAHRRK